MTILCGYDCDINCNGINAKRAFEVGKTGTRFAVSLSCLFNININFQSDRLFFSFRNIRFVCDLCVSQVLSHGMPRAFHRKRTIIITICKVPTIPI